MTNLFAPQPANQPANQPTNQPTKQTNHTTITPCTRPFSSTTDKQTVPRSHTCRHPSPSTPAHALRGVLSLSSLLPRPSTLDSSHWHCHSFLLLLFAFWVLLLAITYHLSHYHLSHITYHISHITYHSPPITYHISLINPPAAASITCELVGVLSGLRTE